MDRGMLIYQHSIKPRRSAVARAQAALAHSPVIATERAS